MGNIKVELEPANQSEGITELEGRPLRRSSVSSLVTSAVKFLDETSTRMSLEAESNLPSTPRLIMLGQSLMTATCWMVSAEGRVIVELDKENTFADAMSVFFGSFYVLNLEYQESACATLELIQRYMIHDPCFLDIYTRQITMKTSSLAILQEAVSVQ
ncbi:G2/M phase-specific E3 ubiquitin-protein ligase [Sarotherodon galilaeus]